MRQILGVLLLLLGGTAGAQQYINCENTPSVIHCSGSTTHDTKTGDQLYVAGGKINANTSSLWTFLDNLTGTGTGAVVFANGASLTGADLNTPTAIVLLNGTQLPLTTGVTGVLPVANGGTGTASPSLIAGSNITITGSYPNQTVNSTASGSGTVNNGTTNQAGCYASTGTAISGCTLGVNFSITGGVLNAIQPLGAQTGTSYTFQSTDGGKVATFSNASAIAGTLPAFTTGYSVDVQNIGSTLFSVTPSGALLNGSSSAFPIEGGLGCTFTFDGTNYQVSACPALIPYTPLIWNANQTFDAGITFGNLTGGAPSASTTWQYGGGWSGTGGYAVTPLRWAAHWDVIPDTMACLNTGVGATGLCGDYECYDNLQSGWDGFRFCYEGFTVINSAPQTITYAGKQVSTNATNMKCRVQANVAMGGIGGSYGGANGSLFCFNSFNSGLTNALWLALESSEADSNSTAFAGPVASKLGWNVTLAGNCGSSTCASESPAGYDNYAYLAGNADDNGTSYWDVIFDAGSEAHTSPSNYATTLLGAHRRFLGSGIAAYNQPTFKDGFDCNGCAFAAPLSGTYSTTISAITPDPGGTNTAVTLTFGAMTTTPPMGSILTVSGATGSAAVYNGGHVVIGNGTTTTAMFATSYIPTASVVSCSSGCGTATVTLPQGYAIKVPDAAIDGKGTITGSTLQVGSGGVVSGTATIGAINVDPQPYGGYVGGALFGGGNPVIHVLTPNGETPPTISGINSFVSAALLMTDQTSFVSSAAAAPNGTQVATGCNNNDVIKLTSGTYSVQATFTVSTDGSGHATSVAITNPGVFTVMGGTSPTWTTTGACNTANINTWLQVGFGISSVTLSANGSGYPPAPAPAIYITGYTGTINTRPKLSASLTVTSQPVPFPNGLSTSVASAIPISGVTTNTAAASGAVGEYQEVNCGWSGPGALTISAITNASPAVITLAAQMTKSTLVSSTAWACPVNFTGTLPTGLSTATTYYVSGSTCTSCNTSTPSFSVSTTVAGALAATGLVGTSSSYTSGGSANPGISAPTTATWMVGGALNVTAGDWDCSSLAELVGSSLTTYTGVKSAIYNVAASVPIGQDYTTLPVASASIGSPVINLVSTTEQELLSGTTSEYGNTFITYGGGTVTLDAARIRCRRVH